LKRAILIHPCSGPYRPLPPRRKKKRGCPSSPGGTGGVYYPLGGAIANVLSKYLPGGRGHRRGDERLDRQPEAHRRRKGGHRLHHGGQRLGGLQRHGKIQGEVTPACPRRPLRQTRPRSWTVQGRGIEKMSDLKGKRISTGAPGSGTELIAAAASRSLRHRPGEGRQARRSSASRNRWARSRTTRSTPSYGRAAFPRPR